MPKGRRYPMKKSKSKRNFSRNSKVKKKNIVARPMRGGIRL